MHSWRVLPEHWPWVSAWALHPVPHEAPVLVPETDQTMTCSRKSDNRCQEKGRAMGGGGGVINAVWRTGQRRSGKTFWGRKGKDWTLKDRGEWPAWIKAAGRKVLNVWDEENPLLWLGHPALCLPSLSCAHSQGPCPFRDPQSGWEQGRGDHRSFLFWAQGKMCGAKRSEWRAKSSQRHCSKEGMGLEEVYLWSSPFFISASNFNPCIPMHIHKCTWLHKAFCPLSSLARLPLLHLPLPPSLSHHLGPFPQLLPTHNHTSQGPCRKQMAHSYRVYRGTLMKEQFLKCEKNFKKG